MDITQLKPQGIWQCFHALTQVPRPSGHLEKIQEFLLQWAQNHGFESFKDNAGNIIVRVPATPGREDRKMVTFEAHMDMVPQKTPDSTHNFLTDPIQTYIDGDWVRARNTTLGADDGMGVATAMAIFEDKTLQHGPLEAIFTVDEESSMYGVNNLRPDTLKGEILLNLDNEKEGEFIIGSAGGVDVVANMDYTPVAPTASSTIQISLRGLKGGHSGLEINTGRANANKLLANIALDALEMGAEISTWEGGNMRNAIPSYGDLLLVTNQPESIQALAPKWEAIYKEEYQGIEGDFTITATSAPLPTEVVPPALALQIARTVMAVYTGVFRNIPSIPHIVETSCNMGIVNVGKGKAHIDVLARGSLDSKLNELARAASCALQLGGFNIHYSGQYPAWQPDVNSSITKTVQRVYKEVHGEDCNVTVVHAGLECGIIKTVYPQMDVVSFGPTLRAPHTPNEGCYIPSVEKYYNFVVRLLENI